LQGWISEYKLTLGLPLFMIRHDINGFDMAYILVDTLHLDSIP